MAPFSNTFALCLLAIASAANTVAHSSSSNLSFLTTFPTTYTIDQAANTRWAADPSNQNPVNLYLMDYTGLEVRQTLCADVAYTEYSNCTWWPDGSLNPNNNYRLMLNQSESTNYTAGDVTILAAGSTALSTGASQSSSTSSSTSTVSQTSTTSTAGSTSSALADLQLQSQSKGLGTGATVGIAVGCTAVGVSLLGLLAFLVYRRRASRKPKLEGGESVISGAHTSPQQADDADTGDGSNPMSADGTVVGTTCAGDQKHPLGEMPIVEKPGELMDPESQPRFELDGTEIYEMPAPRVT